MEPKTSSDQEPQSFWARFSTTIKGMVIFFLILILMIPAAMVESLIFERESRQQEAFNEVSGKWGRRQTLSGPYLCVPYEVAARDQERNSEVVVTQYAIFLPEQLKVNGTVNPEIRKRGIFEVVLYNSKLQLDGQFSAPRPEKLIPANARIQWDRSVLVLGIPDLVGLKDQVSLRWNDQNLVFEPGLPFSGLTGSGISVPVSLSADGGACNFHIETQLNGSESLFFTPVGKVTEVALQSPWSDPSFTGAFLPDEKDINASGFNARWKVLNLNRNYGQQWTSDQTVETNDSAFGVGFLLPVDNYQKSTRSVKYAILFISLTFLAVFFVEMRQTRRVHPFQYALIGLGLVIFYTLLVSISEHLCSIPRTSSPAL
jgi:inner membrane protein